MEEGFLGKVRKAYANGIGNEKYKEAIEEMIFKSDNEIDITTGKEKLSIDRDGR